MNDITAQLAAIRAQLDRADRSRDVTPALTTGHLIIAISQLADVVEQLNERYDHLSTWMDQHAH